MPFGTVDRLSRPPSALSTCPQGFGVHTHEDQPERERHLPDEQEVP